VTQNNQKILFVCSSGGHIDQLFWLRSWWKHLPTVWATFDKPDARDRMDGLFWYSLAFPTNRNVANAIRNALKAIRILRRERPAVLVSSGAGPAVPFFWIGKLLFRCRTVYLEPWDRVSRPTLTARLVQAVTNLGIASSPGQLPHWSRVTESLAPLWRLTLRHYQVHGDGETATGAERRGTPVRVLVTVGTHEEPYDRLIQLVESLADGQEPGGVEFACQHGVSRLAHGYASACDRPFFDYGGMVDLMNWADILIAPASPGAATLGLRTGCRLLLLPRLAVHNEAVDDHQRDFMRVLGRLGLAEELTEESFALAVKQAMVSNPASLEGAWRQACDDYAQEVARAVLPPPAADPLPSGRRVAPASIEVASTFQGNPSVASGSVDYGWTLGSGGRPESE
jgi:beta-1,4-N-acetylglucosaminyltransferase